MKNITKVGLSALAGALAFTSANAGEMSLTGSMEATFTKGSGYHTSGSPLGMDKGLTVSGSGELDNGTTVAYTQAITDAMAFDDSELSFGNVWGTTATVALTSTGSPLSAIDDVTPTAYEEANALVGSIDDVNGVDGTYGIRATMSDVGGSGFKVDAMYVYEVGAGDANGDNASSGVSSGNNDDGMEITITGSVPMVEGLDIGVGYANLDKYDASTGEIGQEEGTYYVKYATGPVSIGYQRGVVNSSSGTADTMYDNRYMGISYKISDDLSVSYNEMESNKDVSKTGTNIDQDFDSISISYSVGGMVFGIADADVSNSSYTSGRTQEATTVSMSIAF